MKIKIISLFTLLLIISCAPGKFRENQLDYFQEIKGKVAEIKTTKINYDDNTGEVKSVYPYIIKYNNDNQPLEEIDVREGSSGQPNSFYKYNPKGQLGKVIGTSETGLYTFYEYRYDQNGRVIEWKTYEPSGNLHSTRRMKYDKWDNLIEEITETGGPNHKTTVLSYSINYKTRAVTREKYHDGVKDNSKTVEYFDKKGNPVRMDWIKNGKTRTAYKKFDNLGNEIEAVDLSGNPVTYVYKFDDVGNVVRQDAYYKGKPFFTRILEITYRK